MKLLNHQKRLDDLQRDLLVSESESSQHRMALEKKDFEVRKPSNNSNSSFCFLFVITSCINYMQC